MAAFNPPTNMDFSMGSTEQKMSMSLDDIIKHTKKEKGKMHRAAIKNGNRKLNGPGAKAALQKSVASRSASMRQGKLAQARSNNGGVNFPATQAASKKAFAAPVNTRSRQFMNSSEPGRRNAPGRRRNGQKLANTYAAAGGNMKILVVNNPSKNGAGRPSGTFGRRKAMAGPNRQATSVAQNSNPVQNQRPKTLDSLFASIRNNAQQAAPAQQGGRRRGGGWRPAA
ncbi:unnamed protein product [Sphagnum jensenii]|uniref:Uncharacterized protein n=1 Tax=Sphagnum jensenii TaxID=128206 RepID=A0ABP0X2R4_9BRYO